MEKLKVSNMIVTGKIPVKNKILFEVIIKKSDMLWQVVNEERSPILTTRFVRDGDERNKFLKKKSIWVGIFTSGHINISGVKSLQEANDIYKRIIYELSKFIKMNGEEE